MTPELLSALQALADQYGVQLQGSVTTQASTESFSVVPASANQVAPAPEAVVPEAPAVTETVTPEVTPEPVATEGAENQAAQ